MALVDIGLMLVLLAVVLVRAWLSNRASQREAANAAQQVCFVGEMRTMGNAVGRLIILDLIWTFGGMDPRACLESMECRSMESGFILKQCVECHRHRPRAHLSAF